MPDRRLIDALVLVAGALLPLAFAPFGWWPVVFPVVMFLLWSWLHVTAARAALRGFIFGLGCFGVGTSWVYVSLNKFGGMAPPIAVVAVFLFVALLAAFIALTGALVCRLHGPQPASGWSPRLLLLAPAVWVVCEWLRSLWVVSFPWLSLGYSQSGTPIAGVAAVGGVYSLSLIVVLLATLALGLLLGTRRQRVGCGVAIAATVGLGVALDGIEWTEPAGDAVETAMVQANIPIEDKWRAQKIPAIQQAYLDLSRDLSAQLIVWPEAALPRMFEDLSSAFWDELAQHPASFVFGVVERRPVTEPDDSEVRAVMHNSAVIAVSNEKPALYRKNHLVAFGEYVPFGEWLRRLVEYMAIPMADFRPWPAPQGAYAAAGTRLGVSICYEDSFPHDVRRALPEAGVLINISEDAWFGDSFGPHQRLQMGSIRAIENGRPMLRSSNTGVTAVLDHRGRVLRSAPQFVRTVLSAKVQPRQGVTPFVRFGSWPVLILCGLILILGCAGVLRSRKSA